jgi:hypothetical protein
MVMKQDGPDSSSATARSSHVTDPDLNIAERDGLRIPEVDASGYRIREEPFGTRRKLRVVLMGAGASTVNFLKKTEERMQNLDVTVYEKNHDIGGTWLENRYPGCACDVCSPAIIKLTLADIHRSQASTINSHGKSRPGSTSTHTPQRSSNTSKASMRRTTSSTST